MTPRPAWRWNAFASRFVTALVVISVVATSTVAYAYWFAYDQIARTQKAHIEEGVLADVKPTEPANYLIVGSDTREWVKGKLQADQFGDPKSNPENLADVIMIAHVDPNAPGKGFIVSIPRDTWVPIPGHGSAKINAAFNYGDGPTTLIETIQNNFNFKINHYLKLDFVTFTDVVKAIGRVHIFFPAPARDFYTGLDIKNPGCVALNSTQALAYARSRHYRYKTATSGNDPHNWPEEGDQDLGRIRRQQSFMRSLAQEAIKNGARSPLTAQRLLKSIVPHLEVDRHMGLQEFLGLVRAFRSVDPGAVQMQTLPTERQFVDGQDAQVVNDTLARPILDQLRSFAKSAKPLPKIAHKSITVQVLNGSGVKGAAGRSSTALLAAGFADGGAPGDADRSDYPTTTVRYAPGAADKARVVAAYLGGVGTVVARTGAAANSDADVVVVLGRDFTSVAKPGSRPRVTATSSTLPTNPGTTPGVSAPVTKDGLPAVGCT